MNWQPPSDWRRIMTIDAHAEGEPLRVITSGLDPIPGATILEKRRYAREHLDGLRRSLVFEPRGHADMYGAIVTEPVTPDADLGVLFMHNEGWSTMCGHGIIGLVAVALEAGLLSLRERKKHATQERLFHEALNLFRRKGFAATTVDEIAAAADVSKGTFFNYSPTKEAVLAGDAYRHIFLNLLRMLLLEGQKNREIRLQRLIWDGIGAQ